ncbi:MAG TPA: DUF411 domain-containing protein [Dehalococcoidia bacterium]|nr:DUF411 domain-containing protein [Dehalococcoidia bacterium]
MDYLQDNGVTVETVMTEDTATIKEQHGIPEELWSCHTTIVDGYYIEGHVPIDVVLKLLDERPAIDGIALPGMPSGSPGMDGEKDGPWVIYAVSGSAYEEFITV